MTGPTLVVASFGLILLSLIVGAVGILVFHRRADRSRFGTDKYEHNFWRGQLCLSLAQAFAFSGSALGFIAVIVLSTD